MPYQPLREWQTVVCRPQIGLLGPALGVFKPRKSTSRPQWQAVIRNR